jgi:hypothetical protein
LKEGAFEEEGELIENRSCNGHISLRIVSMERKHPRAHCGEKVFPSELQGARVLNFSG